MSSNGPSPLVPCLIVGFLGLIIFWPIAPSIMESIGSFLQIGIWVGLLILFLLLLLPLPSSSSSFFAYAPMATTFRVQQTSSQDVYSEGVGFGLGTLLFCLLFLVLYNLV